MATEKKELNVIANEERMKQSVSLTPKLRFKEFEGDWLKKLYGDIYSFYSTNSYSRDKLNYNKKGVRNIHYGDIHTKFSSLFNIENELVPFINKEVNLTRIKEGNYCQIGDLVIADASEDYNDIGKSIEIINLNGEKTLAGLHTFLARPNKYKMYLGFSNYLVQSWKVRKQIMTIAQGTKVLGIATSRLSKIELNLPTLQEQQKIVSFLTAVDNKIQQLTQKKTLLEQYKKGAMQQIFSQQLRFKPDTNKPDVIANSNVIANASEAISNSKKEQTSFPDWEEKKLGEVARIITGSTPSTNNQKYYGGSKLFVSPADIQENKYVFNTKTTLTELGFKKGRIVKKNSVLFVCIGSTIGKVAQTTEECLTNQQINVLEANKNNSNDFIYSILSFRGAKIKLLAGVQAVPQINKTDFSNLKFSFPSLKEQQKIATYLSAIDTKIESVQTQIAKTQTFKKGLLQQLFV